MQIHSILFVAMVVIIGGCGDAVETPANDPPARSENQPQKEQAGRQWLDQFSHEDAAEWLVARQKNAAPGDRDVEKVRAVLNATGRRFEESPRMIANRALQLQDMLNALGDHTSAVALTRDLHSVLGGTAASPGFGNLGAYYVNLRKTGASRTEALAILQKKYDGAFISDR